MRRVGENRDKVRMGVYGWRALIERCLAQASLSSDRRIESISSVFSRLACIEDGVEERFPSTST